MKNESNLIVLSSGLVSGTLGGNQVIMIRYIEKRSQIGKYTKMIAPLSCNEHISHISPESLQIYYSAATQLEKRSSLFAVRSELRSLYQIRTIMKKLPDSGTVYSSSDFWNDVIPAAEARRSGKVRRWVASLFLWVPNPIFGYSGSYDRKLKIPNLRNTLYFLYQQIAIALINRYADYCVITNDNDSQFLDSRFIQRQQYAAIYGGVNVPALERLSNAYPTNTAVFIGRIHEQKGVFLLPEIWSYVVRANPRAVLTIIGSGSINDEKELLRRIHARRMQKNIIFAGYVTGLDREPYIQAAKMVLHPSLYDNFGMAALEAMAYKKPAVLFDLPGNSNIYTNGVLCAPRYNTKEFAKLINVLDRDESIRQMLGSAGRGLAERYSWSEAVGRMEMAIDGGN